MKHILIVEDVKELCSNMAIVNKGKVLLQGDPNTAIDNLENRIYSKTVSKAELVECRNNYSVLAEKLLRGEHIIQVYSDEKISDGFKLVKPELSDVYFNQIYQSNNY